MLPDQSERDRFGNFSADENIYPDPPTCDRCGAVHGDWDNYCEECGAPVGEYARLKEAGMLEAFIHSRTPVTEDTPF